MERIQKFVGVLAAYVGPVFFVVVQNGINGWTEWINLGIALLTAAGVLVAKNTVSFPYVKTTLAAGMFLLQLVASYATDDVVTNAEWIFIAEAAVAAVATWYFKNEGTVNGVFVRDTSSVGRRVA
jgi:hypothetical protein